MEERERDGERPNRMEGGMKNLGLLKLCQIMKFALYRYKMYRQWL